MTSNGHTACHMTICWSSARSRAQEAVGLQRVWLPAQACCSPVDWGAHRGTFDMRRTEGKERRRERESLLGQAAYSARRHHPAAKHLNPCTLVAASEMCCGAGGLLSKDSPFLDIILEGVKLRLPSAEVAYPRVEPALGAALLVHDALHRSSSSIEEAASSPFASTPPRLGRHATLPHSHGEAAALSVANSVAPSPWRSQTSINK